MVVLDTWFPGTLGAIIRGLRVAFDSTFRVLLTMVVEEGGRGG